MSFIKTVDEEKASGDLSNIYETLKEMFGVVPSIFRSQSLMPSVLEPVVLFVKRLMIEDNKLTRFQKELIASYVSKVNSCSYWVDAHSAMAMVQGYTKEQVDSILNDVENSSLIDEKTKALLNFSEKITRHAYKVTEMDYNILNNLGLSEEEILEAVYVAAGFNMIDRLADALGTPLDNFVDAVSKG